MGDLELVKSKIGALIQKPKMNDKLLGKPPFRFLHDTISAIISTTGFAEGLYSPEEQDSSNITDKNAKIDYLTKIFNCVGISQVKYKELNMFMFVYQFISNCLSLYIFL